jgi:hypothetical protein
VQQALFALVQQPEALPASLNSFLQGGGVGYLLKLMQDGLDWASDWDDSEHGADEQTMRAAVRRQPAAVPAGRAALADAAVVDGLLQLHEAAAKQQSGACADHVYVYASLALVRMEVHDEHCRKEIAAQGGLPRFLQTMVDEGLTDQQVQQKLEDCCQLARNCIEAASSDDSTQSESGFESN